MRDESWMRGGIKLDVDELDMNIHRTNLFIISLSLAEFRGPVKKCAASFSLSK